MSVVGLVLLPVSICAGQRGKKSHELGATRFALSVSTMLTVLLSTESRLRNPSVESMSKELSSRERAGLPDDSLMTTGRGGVAVVVDEGIAPPLLEAAATGAAAATSMGLMGARRSGVES